MIPQIFILFLTHVVVCYHAQREYMIKSDLFKGIKVDEYSIYDFTGKNLQYRIESKYHVLHSIEVYDDRYQRWFKGLITKTHIIDDKWKIKYNGRLLAMEYQHCSRAFKRNSMAIPRSTEKGTLPCLLNSTIGWI